MALSRLRRVHEPYIWAAIAFALTAGFGYAAVLVAALAMHLPQGAWWVASIQAHGHAQLFGWAGLFVLGVGLFFVPRLRGTTLARAELAPWALVCFVVGITLHALCQPLLAIDVTNSSQPPPEIALGRSGLVLSGVAEVLGAALIILMLAESFRRARPLSPDAPILPVRFYLATAAVSFCLAILMNAWLALDTALRGAFLYPANWDDALTHLMIMGFIVPIALALSVRNLPLFMRLAFPPKRLLTPLLASYVIGLILREVGQLIAQTFYAGLGAIVEGAVLLVFIWELDALLRRKPPWTVHRTAPPPGYVETRKQTRPNYPDYGEFGRFEWLILSAYAWLSFASLVAVVNGAAMVVGSTALFNPDIERHAVTLGFITLLIFGMAVRMVPGFSGKTRIASTRLVLATFVLGNLATILRIAPLFAPDAPGALVALGLSGTVGWLAVACLAVNWWRTLRT